MMEWCLLSEILFNAQFANSKPSSGKLSLEYSDPFAL